jgi:hypothetical protein
MLCAFLIRRFNFLWMLSDAVVWVLKLSSISAERWFSSRGVWGHHPCARRWCKCLGCDSSIRDVVTLTSYSTIYCSFRELSDFAELRVLPVLPQLSVSCFEAFVTHGVSATFRCEQMATPYTRKHGKVCTAADNSGVRCASLKVYVQSLQQAFKTHVVSAKKKKKVRRAVLLENMENIS